MAKTQFLTFEVHLNDAAQVATLQATTQLGDAATGAPQIAAGILYQAPYNPTAPGYGAAVWFGTVAVPLLPMIGPNDTKPTGPYLYSEWFTSQNNYPRDNRSFMRKSGGWFGIHALFGTETRFYWRGVFVYDVENTNIDPVTGVIRENIQPRRWMEGFCAHESYLADTGVSNASIMRGASRVVGEYGFAFRGTGGAESRRTNTVVELSGLAPSATSSWERLYLRLVRAGTGAQIWRSHSSPSLASGGALAFTASGQIAAYNIDNVGTTTLLGSTTALTPNVWYKVDILVNYLLHQITIYLNGVVALTATVDVALGGLGQVGSIHTQSEIGETGVKSCEYDIGFWHNAPIPPSFSGLDWVNGSRAVLVRPSAFAAGHANWTGDFRLLAQKPLRREVAAPSLSSVVALAELRVATDAGVTVDNFPGSIGVACFVVHHDGHRGTLDGQIGYKLGAAARVLKAMSGALGVALEGIADGASRSWSHVLVNCSAGVPQPVTITPFELHRLKGNDAVASRTDHISATVELIGTWGEEDYPVGTPATLRLPLPFLGVHNAPYPRTPWARTASPPFSPVVIHSGTYVGNGTGQDLLFRAPVHWIWIRRLAGFPSPTRWYSSRLGAGNGERSPYGHRIPDQLINTAFVSVAPGAPTGVGAFPDRSAAIPAIVATNIGLLDGNDDHKRDLAGIIARQLNVDFPADGNNWGLLEKQDRTPPFVATDILVWKPTRDHVDILTDTGATWSPDGILTNPAWVWKAAGGDGSQEQQTIVRIAGLDNDVNNLGDTYMYVAVSDPGQRFMLNGAFANMDANTPATIPLIDSRFLAQAGFFNLEIPGIIATQSQAYAGVGHAGDANKIDTGTNLISAITFALGQLTHNSGLTAVTPEFIAYNLWRRDDGSTDAGRTRVVAMMSYVGTGAGARSIAINPASSRRPLFALIVPHGTPAYYKDPSHAGGNASDLNGTQINTAIVSGDIDTITVGATLNVNLTVYDVFVILGGTVAGADGFSAHGEFIPVEPDSPTGSQWGEDGEEPTDETPDEDVGSDTAGAPGGGTDDIDTDLVAACLPFTHRVVNIALSRIGISQPVLALGSENSEPAQLCRLHLGTAIEQTLRDFPWPFATRYADLVLLAGSTGSPVNRDWTYAYQRPSDCVFERRIVVVRDGAVDPTPPPFQLSFDNALRVGRIFTNQADARLEYTARPECSAGRGDPLFRDALAWKLAGQVAGPLARIADVMKLCSDQYDAAIEKARQVLRPGNPGPKTTLDPNLLDTGTGAIAANIAVVNLALLRIGARTIANLDQDQSREAAAARILFEEELEQVLRAHPWSFATAYEAAPALVGGTATVPVNDDWQYSYRTPSGCVFVRRIVDELRRSRSNREPEMFRIGSDVDGSLIFCDDDDPTFEFTARIANCVLRSEALFREAFAWKLAASLAPTLAQVDPDETEQKGRGPQDRPRERKPTESQLRDRVAQRALQMYRLTIEQARIADLNEKQEDPDDGDADWIRGRE